MNLDFNDISPSLDVMNDNYFKQFHQINLQNIVPVTNPVVEQLRKLVEESQEQNKILLRQVELLREENERQKEQIASSKAAEQQAKKEAKHSKVFGWVTFAIATAISVAALVVSIISI